MNCEIVRVQANTEEWLALRRGRLTASHAGDWMAKPTTKRYKDYMQLIVMQLLGFEEEEDDAPWFAHGKAMEPFARAAYEWKYGIEVTPDIFLIHPEWDWLGCSPDGVFLPDLDGMIEIKCRNKFQTYIDKVAAEERLGKIDAMYRPQVQCQMLVSGLDSIDFINYYHDEEQRVRKMNVFPVMRDEAYIAKLEEKAIEFMTECYRTAELYPKITQRMRTNA